MQRTNKILALACLASLGGCSEYLNHEDTLTMAAGDANRINRMLQAEDPFAERAFDTSIEGDGERAVLLFKRHQKPFSVQWPTINPATTAPAASK